MGEDTLARLAEPDQKKLSDMVVPEREVCGSPKYNPPLQYDPKDVALKTAAIKFDQGKPPMSLLSTTALVEIAKVLEFGKNKYGKNNYKSGMAWSRVLDAPLRHIFAFIDKEDNDPESGISHIAHACCSLMFLLEFIKTHPELDDR